MEKLTHTIPSLRVDEKTHQIIHEIAHLKDRRGTEIVRLSLSVLVKYYEETGKWLEKEDIPQILSILKSVEKTG